MYQHVRLEHRSVSEGGPQVAVLTIDRPKALNALNPEVLSELGAALDEVGSACALVITGGVAKMNASVGLNRLAFGVGQGDWKTTEVVPGTVTVNISLTAKRAP